MNLMIWYGYNEYMAHHYAYMVKVAIGREPESYSEAARGSELEKGHGGKDARAHGERNMSLG